MLKEEAKKAGLDLELNLVDGATGFSLGDAGEEARGGLARLGRRRSLPAILGVLPRSDNANKPQTNNLFNVADKELDTLIDAYNVEFDMAKRAGISRQIQQRIWHDLAIFVPGVQLQRMCGPAAGAT